jgi:hypothetical protein
MRRFTTSAFLLLAALLVSFPGQAQDIISTTIGGGPNGIPALDANLYNPYGVAVDTSGNYYIASFNQHRVFKVNTTGTISVVAGSGAQGYSGDGVGVALGMPAYTIRSRWQSTVRVTCTSRTNTTAWSAK